MFHIHLPAIRTAPMPWNKGRLVGQKRPLLPQHVWSIPVRLELAGKLRELALFNLAIDSKLRGCDDPSATRSPDITAASADRSP